MSDSKTKAPKAEGTPPSAYPYPHIPLAIAWFEQGPPDGHAIILKQVNDGIRTIEEVIAIMRKSILTTCVDMCEPNCQCPAIVEQLEHPEFRQFLAGRMGLA